MLVNHCEPGAVALLPLEHHALMRAGCVLITALPTGGGSMGQASPYHDGSVATVVTSTTQGRRASWRCSNAFCSSVAMRACSMAQVSDFAVTPGGDRSWCGGRADAPHR